MIARFALVLALALGSSAMAQTPKQPRVQPGPMEPDLAVVLETLYGLKTFDDLKNPVETAVEATPGLFRKAGPGPVTFRPVVALGLEVPIRGGFYPQGDDAKLQELWSYKFKNTTKDIETKTNLPPPLSEGSKADFDPGEGAIFGLWIGNDQFQDRVYSEPALVKLRSPRLAKQPYKAMIYPFRDKSTGKLVPNSYLIGWEYSTNDDFQDVMTRIDNVELVAEKTAGK